MPKILRLIVAAVMLSSTGVTPHAEQNQPAGPARPRITGIAHVALRVSDLNAARAFYGDLLGLHARSGLLIAGAIFDVGPRQQVRLEPGLTPQQDDRMGHLAFETIDIEAMKTYLTAKGVAVREKEGCEATALRVTDPDGHIIEFVQVEWPRRAVSPTSPYGRRALSTRLLHAGLTVRDDEAAHKFYRDVLGFSEIWRGGRNDTTTDWINMRVPDGTEYLEYMLQRTPPDRRELGTRHHLCLVVPDIQAAYDEAVRRTPADKRASMGVPNVGRNGRWQLNLYDPDGTRTELMEPFRIR